MLLTISSDLFNLISPSNSPSVYCSISCSSSGYILCNNYTHYQFILVQLDISLEQFVGILQYILLIRIYPLKQCYSLSVPTAGLIILCMGHTNHLDQSFGPIIYHRIHQSFWPIILHGTHQLPRMLKWCWTFLAGQIWTNHFAWGTPIIWTNPFARDTPII